MQDPKVGPTAKPAADGFLLTDQDILGCMDAEKLWRRIRKLAGAGAHRFAESPSFPCIHAAHVIATMIFCARALPCQ